MAEALLAEAVHELVDTVSSDILCVVTFGDIFKYTIPEFSVITVKLRRVKVQRTCGSEREVRLFDVFLNVEADIEIHPPACIEVIESCVVQAGMFSALQLLDMQLLNNVVLIVWKYKEILNENESDNEERIIEEDEDDRLSESTAESSDSEKEDHLTMCNPCVPHTIVFKCIGAARDPQSQITLRTARDRMSNGYTVPVRMKPEPTNIVDSRAIVFECKIEKWHKIGYVVSDILDEVHAAISANLIVSVKFKCIKYVTHWTQSVIGYYTGISVTKNGHWHRRVKLFQSTIQ